MRPATVVLKAIGPQGSGKTLLLSAMQTMVLEPMGIKSVLKRETNELTIQLDGQDLEVLHNSFQVSGEQP